jgi:hypothetical protein
MLTQCTERTNAGELVALSYSVPQQEAVDAGDKPSFFINVLPLLAAQESGRIDDKSFGLLTVDAEAIFLEEAVDAEGAETVAQWLEAMAETVRDKFKLDKSTRPEA